MINKRKIVLYLGLPIYGVAMSVVHFTGILSKTFGIIVDTTLLSWLNPISNMMFASWIAIGDVNRNMLTGISIELLTIFYIILIITINIISWLPISYVINRCLDNCKKPKCLYFRPKKR